MQVKDLINDSTIDRIIKTRVCCGSSLGYCKCKLGVLLKQCKTTTIFHMATETPALGSQKMDTFELIKKTISNHGLYNWFSDYPWLKDFIGNQQSSVWFIGENPSLRGVEAVDKRSLEKDDNLQWNSHSGDWLLRESLTKAGLKTGDYKQNTGWNCYITNVIKQPELVNDRNAKKRNSTYWQDQAIVWMPVLQFQIENGNPKVLVALGSQVMKILKYMIRYGLQTPKVEQIHHYSYIMKRPESGTKRGPGHPERIKEFQQSIVKIANNYNKLS